MKLFTKGVVISLGIVVLSLLFGVYFYPILPDQIASHWGAMGEVNGYMSKLWGILFIPILLFVLLSILVMVPRFDPKKEAIEKMTGIYDAFLILLSSFFFLLQLFIVGSNLVTGIDPARIFPFLFGLLFIGLGFLIERVKQNWTIGIRNPWTLSSEAVWDKTHKAGGKVFKIVGVIACFGIVFPTISFLVFLIPLIAGVVGLFIYSYQLYKREKKSQ
ncbi:MAG: DUF1648 domain-containing protein [Candidatus Paceibacterota bacterium]